MGYLEELNIDNDLSIEHIYTIDGYMIILTNKNNYLYDGENLYSLNNYKNVNKVIVFNNEIYVVINDDKACLVKLENLEVILQTQNLIGMNYLNERYVSVHSYGEKTRLFDLKNKEFIKCPLELKFDFILADDLFVFENNEYDLTKHKRYLVNSNGDIIYKCESSFPYFVNGNLYLINKKDEEINIIHDFLGKRDKSTIIKKQGIVLGKPQYYDGDIIIVVEDGILVMDADLNIKKKILYCIKYPISDTTIERDSFLMKIRIGDKYRTVCVGLNVDYVIEHDSVELLPYWLDRKRTLKCYDTLDNNLRIYYLYDESGKLLYQIKSQDAHIVENENYNLFIFYGVDGEDKNIVFDISTNDEIAIPWINIEFYRASEDKYDKYALCFNKKTNLVDIVNEELRILFSEIDLKKLKIKCSYNQVLFSVNNNYLCIFEPITDGPRTFFRRLVLDKENNIIYDGFDTDLTNISNYIEFKTSSGVKYLNTLTGEFSMDDYKKKLILLPDELGIQDNSLVLKKVISK